MKVRHPLAVSLAAILSSGYLCVMAAHAAAAPSPAFPKRPPPVWSWSNQSIQAWIGQYEEDRRFGWHHNLHIQFLGGGGQDRHNYHIFSNGKGAWRVFDNGVEAPPSPGNERFYSGTSSSAAQALATDVGKDLSDTSLETALQTKQPGGSDDLGTVLDRVDQFSAWTPLDPNPAPGSAPDISPGAQLTGADCAGYFDFTAPMDPTRPTTLHIDWGDGSHPVDALIPQGTGPYLMSEVNGFPMAPPPNANGWWVTATIVETGAVSASAFVGHGDTYFFDGPGNFVGQFWTWGSRTGYDTSGALAVQTVGLQPYNAVPSGTQDVNSTIAGAFVRGGTNCFGVGGGSAGCFKVYVAPNVGPPTGNGAALASGLYDINIINIGYSNHTTWLNPSGACGGSSGPTPTTRVGFVTVGAAGKIVLAYDANWNPLTVSGNIAGQFAVPNTYISNLQTQEAGVCISDAVLNGGMAPLKLV